jgi:hypothetical protein
MMQESRRPASIPVETKVISIQPLPETGRPKDFSGLVGRFTFTAIPTPLTIALGDLITVTFTIEGDLLPDTYLKPVIKPGADLKVYELKPVKSDNTPERHVSTQTLVPSHITLTAIPSCTLSYFDTRSLRYETLRAGPFPLHYQAEHTPAQSIYTMNATPSNTVTPHRIEPPTDIGRASIRDRFTHRLKQENKRKVIGESDIPVWLAPSESSIKLFPLKPGATVFTGATHENWISVSSPAGSGWVPATALE